MISPNTSTTSQVTGVLPVDKPMDWTSHDVVNYVRKLTGIKKVGHAGTLDPGATGLLLVLIGREATKKSDVLRGQDKTYLVTMKIGQTTDTLDQDGTTTESFDPSDKQLQISEQQLRETMTSFIGTYRQQVPWFSAVKVDGTKLYNLARSGKNSEAEITPPIKEVTVHQIEIKEITKDDEGYITTTFETTVSSGTYTRALVRDIGKKLHVPTMQTALRRTRAGRFSIKQAVALKEASRDDIIPISEVL